MPSGAKTRYIVRWASGNKIYWGIKTGCNEAFVIDEKKRAELISADPNSAEIIKPLAIGDDVRRWHVRDKKRYLIVTRIGVDIQRYPAIFAHLSQYEERLRARSDQGNHWWELRSCDYYDAFDKPKIIYPDIAKEPRFHYDEKGTYFSNTTYFIPSQDKYLIAILNSASMWEYCKRQLTVLGDAEKRGRLRFFSQDVLQLPIPIPTDDIRETLSELVDICLSSSEDLRNQAEKRIDDLVASLYGLEAVKFPE